MLGHMGHIWSYGSYLVIWVIYGHMGHTGHMLNHVEIGVVHGVSKLPYDLYDQKLNPHQRKNHMTLYDPYDRI
jgi:hypothetical protein